MPAYLKAVISLLVIAVAGVTFYLEQRAGEAVLPWVVLGLGTVMILAIWLFPEARKQPK